MDMSQMMASLIFGSIGCAAFLYGTKNRYWRALVIGVALMGFPYVVSSTVWTYVIGAGLCAALFVFRDV